MGRYIIKKYVDHIFYNHILLNYENLKCLLELVFWKIKF